MWRIKSTLQKLNRFGSFVETNTKCLWANQLFCNGVKHMRRNFADAFDEPADVFDRKTYKIHRDLAALREDSRTYDYLRDEVAKRLTERVDVRNISLFTIRNPNLIRIS